jgi:probable phosphoglycerate mutase
MIRRTLRPVRAAAVLVGVLVVLPSTSPAPAAQTRATLQIYLARHGQTDGNLNRIAQGWTDTPLNETGRQHATMLAERLRGVPLDAVYSSTLSRSLETAQAVAAGANLTVRSLPGLREIGLGRFENVSLDDPLMKTRPRGDQRGPDDGETTAQVTERVNAAVAGIRAAHSSGTILIVGHAGANAYVLRALLQMTAQEMGPVLQDNDELYMLEFSPGVKPRVFKFIPQGKFSEL